MKWDKTKIKNKDGEIISAQAPVIISASRATDIPAFYADWFWDRFKEGYIKWRNPFNGLYSFVSFSKARLIVFWSKNPKPIMKYLEYFDKQKVNYYFQYTLNNYDSTNFEKSVGNIDKRIETFLELSELIGKKKVIWRFDPYILSKNLGVDELLQRTEYIAEKIKYATEKLVISFIDISQYKKVQNNLKSYSDIREFTTDEMFELAEGLKRLNESWKLRIGTCAEEIDLSKYNIKHNKCIDDELIGNLFSDDKALMKFIGRDADQNLSLFESIADTNKLKDKGQREACGCIYSKDIGQYNTCPHGCIYCYANTSIEKAANNYKQNRDNPRKDTITGE